MVSHARDNGNAERPYAPVHVDSRAHLIWPNVLAVLVPAAAVRPPWIQWGQNHLPETVLLPGVDVTVGVRHRYDIEVLQ